MAGPIVSCLDGSEQALEATRLAGVLSERLGLRLVLVHVAPRLTEPGVSAALAGQARLAEEERREAEELLEEAAAGLGLPSSVERHVLFGDPAPALLAFCEEREAALVVVGSRGRGGLAAALLGTVSSTVAAKARCVVVIVPPGSAARALLVQGP